MSRPLQIKKTDNKKSSREPTHRRDSNAAAAEQLSDIDEEEEKRMANAFKEANGPDQVYRQYKANTMGKKAVVARQTIKPNRYSQFPSDNQSVVADCAMDCETNRINNDNFRLDMTYAEQAVR